VIGIGGTLGAIGGALMSKYAGDVLDRLGTYAPLFVLAGAAYFLRLLSCTCSVAALTAVEAFRRDHTLGGAGGDGGGPAGRRSFFLASGKADRRLHPGLDGRRLALLRDDDLLRHCSRAARPWSILAVLFNTLFREKPPP
jgi:ACS family hexuronate transporter-like MFS transporter